MRHGHGLRKLNRTSEHRLAMLRNMMNSLIQHEVIKTTLPKAKELRRVIEPMITLAKEPTLANKRLAFNRLRDRDMVVKVFDVLDRAISELKTPLRSNAQIAQSNTGRLRDIDAVMLRTKNRPIAAGRIEPGAALGYGITLAIGSVIVMARWPLSPWYPLRDLRRRCYQELLVMPGSSPRWAISRRHTRHRPNLRYTECGRPHRLHRV